MGRKIANGHEPDIGDAGGTTGESAANGTGDGTSADSGADSGNGGNERAGENRAQTEKETVLTVEQAEPVKKRRGRKPKVAAKQEPDAATAQLLLTLVESLGVSYAGDKARFSAFEHVLLDEPFARTLTRLNLQVTQNPIVDYVMIGIGLGMYGYRVMRAHGASKPTKVAPESAPVNEEIVPTTSPDITKWLAQ